MLQCFYIGADNVRYWDGSTCPCHIVGIKSYWLHRGLHPVPSSQAVESRWRVGFGEPIRGVLTEGHNAPWGIWKGGSGCLLHPKLLLYSHGHWQGRRRWNQSRKMGPQSGWYALMVHMGQRVLLAFSDNFDSRIKNFHICWFPLKSVNYEYI